METKDDLIRAISQTLLRIMATHARIEELPVRFDQGVELTPREIHTIQMIGEHGGTNVTDLAARAGVTKSAASQMVGKLVERGFLEKAYADHSNKELRLSLTPLGQRAFSAHERIHGQHLAEVGQRLSCFSLPQIATTSVVLEVIEGVVRERLGCWS